MPARSLSTGTISFGLVTVPVRLYSAAEHSAAISFNMLHGKCGTRLKQQYVCPQDEEIVTRDQMLKGYEFAKEQYVTYHRGRAQGDGGDEQPRHREHRVRAAEQGGSHLLRRRLLRRARQGGRPGVRPARG